LSHPNIARLIDGGVSSDGRPFLAMEFIEGEPIVEHCQHRGLSVRARVELFRELCTAVEYAHRNLIVHRDLKPSNVLVDAAGSPKLLDFGIARLMEPEAEETSTASAIPLLTPRYASPEQLRGEPVTTASDVYSLGVLLFELVTGQLPYDLRGNAPAEVIAAITTGDARLAGVSDDLDAILAKALEKNPQRRYGSVGAFSADLGNHLAGLPVSARRQTRAYRWRMYLRRHWIGASAAAAVVLILAAATFVSVRSARIANRQRERSDRITRFVIDVLTAANPGNRISGMETGADAKLVDVMAAASARLATQFADDPGIQSELHAAIGRTDIGLGKYKLADAEVKAALDRLAALDAQPAEKARVLHVAARLDFDEGRHEVALQRQREAVRLFAASPEASADPRSYCVMLNNLGAFLEFFHKLDEAAATMERSLEILEKLPSPPSFEIGVLRSNLSDVEVERGRFDLAERDARQAIQTLAQLPHPPLNAGYTEMKLGMIERWTGRADAALADLEKGAADTIRVAGADHPYALSTRIERDYQRAIAGRAEEAEADVSACLDAIRNTKGGINDQRAQAVLGYVRSLAGRATEGETSLRESLAKALRKQFPMTIALTQAELAYCLARQGKMDEARTLLTQAHDSFEKQFGPSSWLAQDAARRLAAL